MSSSDLLGDWSSCEVRQSERTASRVIEGKAMVITVDQNELHVLNGVGTRVWQLLDGRALEAVVDTIVSEFEVEKERAAGDVRRFVEQLFSLGAVQIKRRAGAP